MAFLLFIWQLPQNTLGFIVSRLAKRCRTERGNVYYRWNHVGSVSLGSYIIVSSESVLRHEFGHRRQSIMLGPLYLVIIGLPSLLWCILHMYTPLGRKNYYSFYTEAWAEKLKPVNV